MKGWLVSKPGADERFSPPNDGWVQILAIGDWPNDEAGIVQVCDEEAFNAIQADFQRQAGMDNWPGLLVDFDHFSHSKDKPSGAAGWADRIERRGAGLWAHVRFSESGEKAVRGGEYRLLSPVLTGFQDVDGVRKRPTCLYRLALTNDPNIKGLVPVSNRATVEVKRTGGTTMDHKKVLVSLLGLAESATDEEIAAARTTLDAEVEAFNRSAAAADAAAAPAAVASAEGDPAEAVAPGDQVATIEALNRRVTELETELVERDAAQYEALLGDNQEAKKSLRALLAANRGAARAVLAAVKPQAAAPAKVEVKRPALAPLFNRRIQPLPSGAGGAATEEQADVSATRVRLLAQDILAKNRGNGMTWPQAWGIAKKEIKAGVPAPGTAK